MTNDEITTKIAELELRETKLRQKHAALLRDKPQLYRTRAAAVKLTINKIGGQIAAWRARLRSR